ncbi:MAG TPA: hypothetical protein VIM73_02055 [Polyangiaceae bacterium]
MASRLTASELRANVYRVLDHVLETGLAVEIERKGRLLKIIEDTPAPKLSRLVKRKALAGNPDDIVHMDWSRHWKP